MDAAVASLTALLVTSFLLPVLRHLLIRFNVVDYPNSRSNHQIVTPRGGGLAGMIGIVLGLAVACKLSYAILISVVGFTLLGAFDDWKSLSSKTRLVAQVLLGYSVVVAFTRSDPEVIQPQATIVVVGISIYIFVVNAVNFMDGVNGMSASHGILLGTTFAALSWQVDAPTWAILGLCLAAASMAFIPWNFRRRALLFLGDSGTYLFGAIIALLILVLWAEGTHLLIVLAPIAIYLSDVSVTLMRRAIAGKPILQAHREHTYQALPARGWDHRWTSMLVLIFSSVCCVAALVAQARIISLPILGMLITLAIVGYFVSIRRRAESS